MGETADIYLSYGIVPYGIYTRYYWIVRLRYLCKNNCKLDESLLSVKYLRIMENPAGLKWDFLHSLEAPTDL